MSALWRFCGGCNDYSAIDAVSLSDNRRTYLDMPWVNSMYLKLRADGTDVVEAAHLADVCAHAVGQPMFAELEQPFGDMSADILALPEAV